MSDLDAVLRYHERTKHHPGRYAAGPGYLDWANQPDPFRRFTGTEVVELPFVPAVDSTPLHRLSAHTDAAALSLDTVSQLLERSLAISAWKQYRGHRWALRCNPSSGNLHPTEGYVLLPALAELTGHPGVFHYRSIDHALERRATLADDTWKALTAPLSPDVFLVGLTSIHWREAWKYGERAFRYCQLDVGHAVAALRYAAATLGWRLQILTSPGDEDISALLGLDRKIDFQGVEPEEPDLVAAVVPATVPTSMDEPVDWPEPSLVHRIRQERWYGRASRLSAEVTTWEAIETVTRASRKPSRSALPPYVPAQWPPRMQWPGAGSPPGAIEVIRRRRSAIDFDGTASLSRTQFFYILDALLPRAGFPPFDALPWPPTVHLVLFVHRVEGLEPGLYALLRMPGVQPSLAALTDSGLAWQRVPSAPEHLELYRLATGDFRALARDVSCIQDIAGDGVFSLGMLADFEGSLRRYGPWFYRHLFWECGAIGQCLYLEAEAAGLRATGIGCFFDDWMHRLLGLRGRAFQTLYHLAVGRPVEDTRITTLPAYERAQARSTRS